MNIYTVVAFASLGGILFGLDQGNWAGAIEKDGFKENFCHRHLGDEQSKMDCHFAKTMPDGYVEFLALGSSLMQLGAALGALTIAPRMASSYGRRETMSLGSLLAIIGNFGQCLVTDIHTFLAFRVLDGVGVGMVTYALPMFVSEIAPPAIRGSLGCMMQLTCVIGVVIASLLNTQHWFGYRISFSLPAWPAIIVAVGIFAFPMSPRFAVLKFSRMNNLEAGLRRARESLKVLRSDSSEAEIEAEIEDLRKSIVEAQVERPTSTLWTDRSILRRVLIANMLQWMQQFTGINAILSYGPTIFKNAGVPISGLQASFITNVFNLLFTFVMMATIDRWGRRSLMLLGASLMFVFMGAAAFVATFLGSTDDADPTRAMFGWALLCLVCLYMSAFALGWGGTAWIYPSEIFPMDIKEKALSTSVCSQWIANFAIAYLVPKQVKLLGVSGTFAFYAVCLLVCMVLVYLLVPETKGLALEDMDMLFAGEAKKGDPLVGVTPSKKGSGSINAAGELYGTFRWAAETLAEGGHAKDGSKTALV